MQILTFPPYYGCYATMPMLIFRDWAPVVELTGLFILILTMSGEGGTPGLYGWGGRWEFFEGREGVIFLGVLLGIQRALFFFFLFFALIFSKVVLGSSSRLKGLF